MPITIEDQETQQLAQELAALTGESTATAVAEAIRERLARVRRAQGAGLSKRLMAIGRDCATRMSAAHRSIDHGDLLYGEDGLPLTAERHLPHGESRQG